MTKHSRLTILAIWLVPVAALAAAIAFLVPYYEEHGPLLTIEFEDGSGLRPGETTLQHRGVQIGQIETVALSTNQRRVLVTIRLRRDQKEYALAGATFWIVRPKVTQTGITGINTVFAGPYIDSEPGSGEPTTEFIGRTEPPEPFEAGLHVVLHAPRLDHLQPGASLYFRGIDVGVVRDIRLADLADRVDIRVDVWGRYRHLVRANSHFWSSSGFEFKGGIFSGIELKLDSLRTVIAGSVMLATPDKNMGPPAHDGAEFALEDEPKKEWREWAPRIPIKPARSRQEPNDLPQ